VCNAGRQENKMEMKARLLLLYDLQQLDSALDALTKQYASLDRGQAERERYEVLKAAYEAASQELKTAQTAVKDTELEQQSVDAKKKEEEAKLYGGKVRAAKELQALQDEVEMLDRRRATLDEKMLGLMDGLEGARKRASDAKQAFVAATGALQAKIDAFNSQTELMKAQAMELKRQRNAAADTVPPDLIKRYDRLRGLKNGVAIVAITDGNTCGGCNMGLPSSVVAHVHEGVAIVLCDNCERILCDRK
jgi:predicted  nucleic acid-binding Zn-ribbon protein